MYFFRMKLRINLPLVLLIFCTLNSIVYITYTLRVLNSYFDIFILLGLLMSIVGSIGIGLFVYIFRERQDWMIENISYFFICYLTINIYNDAIARYLFRYEYGGFQWISFFDIVRLLISLGFVILTYEKGILKSLFSIRGYVIDRIFFTYILIYVFVLTIIQGFQLWDFYSNLDGFGSMNNGIEQSIILLMLFSLIFIINIAVKNNLFITRSFNLGYMIFVLMILLGIDFLSYLSSLNNFFSEDDPFSLIGFITSIRLSNFGLVIVFYVIIKLISWKSTKGYEGESLSVV